MTDHEIERRILSAQIAAKEEEIRMLSEILAQMRIEYKALMLNPEMVSSLMERYHINIH